MACQLRQRHRLLYYDNAKLPYENLTRLLASEPHLHEKMDGVAVLDKKFVQSLYYDVLEEAIVAFAKEMQDSDRDDMYDTMLIFLQRVRFDRPLYEEAVAEFIDKQKMYAKTRNSLVDWVPVPGQYRRREPETDFVRAYRKEYYK